MQCINSNTGMFITKKKRKDTSRMKNASERYSMIIEGRDSYNT